MAKQRGMTWVALALSVALSDAASAQQHTDQQSSAPEKRELKVAPSAPADTPEITQRSASNSPANVCQELVAFLQKGPEPGKAVGNAQASKPAHESKDTDQTQHKSGISAPVPSGGSSASTSTVSIEVAEAMLNAGNLSGCQEAVQKARRAGVAMPPSLLALGALRKDLLVTASPTPERSKAAQ
jgi:hypothetical protein